MKHEVTEGVSNPRHQPFPVPSTLTAAEISTQLRFNMKVWTEGLKGSEGGRDWKGAKKGGIGREGRREGGKD